MSGGVCSCGNRFDGDNLCMVSACQWEGIERPGGNARTASTNHTPTLGGRSCSCGWEGGSARDFPAHIMAQIDPAFGGTRAKVRADEKGETVSEAVRKFLERYTR